MDKDPAAPHGGRTPSSPPFAGSGRDPGRGRRGPLQRGRSSTSPGWTGREFEVTVGPVAHGGHCVARHEGRVGFVRHTLPGERVVVRVTDDRSGAPGLRRHRSHDVVPLADCPITVEPAAAAVLSRRWPGAGAVEVSVDSTGTVTTTRLDRRGAPTTTRVLRP